MLTISTRRGRNLRRRASPWLLAAAIAAGLLLCGSGEVRADERSAAVWDRHFAIAAHFDVLPIPLSDIAAVVEIAPIRAVSFEIGGGASVFQHPLFLAMLHVQVPLGRWVPGVELGMVTGPLAWPPGHMTLGVFSVSDDVGYFYREKIERAVFMRGGVSAGFRNSRGVHLRLHGGVTGLVNRGSAYCLGIDGHISGGCELRGIPVVLPYLGATIGYAFNL